MPKKCTDTYLWSCEDQPSASHATVHSQPTYWGRNKTPKSGHVPGTSRTVSNIMVKGHPKSRLWKSKQILSPYLLNENQLPLSTEPYILPINPIHFPLISSPGHIKLSLQLSKCCYTDGFQDNNTSCIFTQHFYHQSTQRHTTDNKNSTNAQ